MANTLGSLTRVIDGRTRLDTNERRNRLSKARKLAQYFDKWSVDARAVAMLDPKKNRDAWRILVADAKAGEHEPSEKTIRKTLEIMEKREQARKVRARRNGMDTALMFVLMRTKKELGI